MIQGAQEAFTTVRATVRDPHFSFLGALRDSHIWTATQSFALFEFVLFVLLFVIAWIVLL